ncbi:hypothetical protein AWC05_20375 [Mycobacterium florentinum]|uniref:Uncharacterized protein n=1 Tax=Mycobacterium florentinum TaxID=292462 RepID=A0A1X1U8F3_MYCFL|nr:hypothetical protein [Mycobacterium florentinum]MCV7410583.1 hypothetical protein [Mycobacterium florentinum]ORV53104.1 hypothetical protein AWC05_20375 [Mycobacterium florentinum]BBX79905.1 hypothetical protein MFLOJ_36920 [Mycobacterium florentinum]
MSTEDDFEFSSDALGFTPIAADEEPDHIMRTCGVCGGYFPTKPGSANDRAALCQAHLLVTHVLMRRDGAGWTEYDHDPYTRRELDSAPGLTQACRGWLDSSGVTSGEWKLEARGADTGDKLAESEVVNLSEKAPE